MLKSKERPHSIGAMHERAWQFGLDDIYTAFLMLWLPLIDEIKAAGRYDEYLKICVGL